MDEAARLLRRNQGIMIDTARGHRTSGESSVTALARSLAFHTSPLAGRGAITNFKIINKRVEHLKQLRTDLHRRAQ